MNVILLCSYMCILKEEILLLRHCWESIQVYINIARYNKTTWIYLHPQNIFKEISYFCAFFMYTIAFFNVIQGKILHFLLYTILKLVFYALYLLTYQHKNHFFNESIENIHLKFNLYSIFIFRLGLCKGKIYGNISLRDKKKKIQI